MKHFLLIFFVANLCTPQLSAQAIEWSSSSWSETFEKARLENKMVFVDIYTTWCSPCFKMDKDVFTASQVGSYFNEDFISIKLDAEDNAEGSMIAKKFDVKIYPTLLFLNDDETLITSATGLKNKYELVSLGVESAALYEHHELLDQVKKNINGNYTFDELKNILTITQIHSFEGKEKLAMSYLDGITSITEEDLRNVMGEIDKMDLPYIKRIAPLTTTIPYKELYLRRNSQEWINWKNNTELSIYNRLLQFKNEKKLRKYEEALELLKGIQGTKSRKIDNLYLDYYRQNDLDQYRTFAIYMIEEYIIPARPNEVKKADEQKYEMLRAEIMKDMALSQGSSVSENGLFVNEQTDTPTIDSLAEVYTISRSIANQLYEISGDFFALFEDESSRRKASFWASLTHLYFPYDWKYFDNHIFILESIGKTEEAKKVLLDAQSLPWYDELRMKKKSF